jgi:hypothetical protein
VADGVQVVPALDALDPGGGLLHPGLDSHDGLAVIADRLDAFEGLAALGLKTDDGLLGPDLFDHAFGDHPVGVALKLVYVGINDLEFDGGTPAIEDKNIHEGSPSPVLARNEKEPATMK